MTLAAINTAGRFRLPDNLIWPGGILLLVGTPAKSGGMFLHMVLGQAGAWSLGNTVTTVGVLLLAAGLITLIYGVVTSRARERATTRPEPVREFHSSAGGRGVRGGGDRRARCRFDRSRDSGVAGH